MRALAGPAVALTVALGFLAFRAASKDEAPSRDFSGLELALPGEPGSCYSLGTTLIANGLFGKAPFTWSRTADDAWRLSLERVIQGYNGPAREFSNWTFEKHGVRVELVEVEASPGLPQDPAGTMKSLLHAPNTIHSGPVARCLAADADGYMFVRK
jgi:hypothetical protein